MKKKITLFLLTFFAFFFGEAISDKKDLPDRYKKWLDEEVVYIIGPQEKEVFLQLKRDREKEKFIEAFWNHRDPTPGSSENENKKEHYRRLNYANHYLGRGAPKPGWRTDRGRIYIILGEPNDIMRIEGKSEVYPSEVWFYQGKTNLGLPPGFHLVFFQKGRLGEYRLYSPLIDGPQALLTTYYGDPRDYLAAYNQLQEVEPSLAEMSLSLITGDQSTTFGRPSMSSDILIQRVESTAVRQIKERYAQKFLEYKDIVELEYTANYINSDSLVKVIKDSSSLYFVHYAIELERLSVNLYQNKYYTTLKLNGTVLDPRGKIIHQFERPISLEFDEEQIKQVSHSSLSIHGMFPLIPGNFKISVLLKNEISKEFTSLERNLLIPGDQDTLQMTSLIIGYNMKEASPAQNRLRPFQIGPYRIYFQANRVFLRQDDLVVSFQIHGLSQALREKGEIKYSFIKNEEEFLTINKRVNEYLELPNFVEKFSLDNFFPAHYQVQVSLFIDGREILSNKEEFDVTHLEAIPRPWISAQLLPGTDSSLYPYSIGTQLFNSGKMAEARASLEKAYQKKKDSIEIALNLARVYNALAKYTKIESILLPFLSGPQPPKYEAYLIMGRAYQNLGNLDKAIDVFDKAISHYGLNMDLLNHIGECYFKLEKKKEALTAWEKSLEINPDQPQIRKNVETLKEKK
ncbi:MAG TPA: GWxTD domain-containing protein [Candidatus Aminicenantes bacterium]|nr:GWxTD domain-containing protein [Candidatus Aminicenantes bacterium]